MVDSLAAFVHDIKEEASMSRYFVICRTTTLDLCAMHSGFGMVSTGSICIRYSACLLTVGWRLVLSFGQLRGWANEKLGEKGKSNLIDILSTPPMFASTILKSRTSK